MGCHRAAIEHAERIEPGHRARAVLLHAIVVLLARFGHVDHQRDRVLVGESATSLQRLGRVRVERVRRHGGRHQRIVSIALDVALGPCQRVFGSLRVGNGKADDRFAKHAAHARLLRGFGDTILEVIHVGEGSGAREHHFEAGQARAPENEIGGDVAGFGGKDVMLKPVLQSEVVGDAAKQGHGRVGVSVDEAGDEDRFGPVEMMDRGVAGIDVRAGVDGNDVRATNGDCAIFDDAVLRVHGDDVAGGPDLIGRLRGMRGDAEEAEEAEEQSGAGPRPAPLTE